jgi:molybdopterin-containing oxidoreductase family iron-sulfur binding subunit
MLGMAMALAAAVGVPGISASGGGAVPQAAIAAMGRDLLANRGAALVVAGDHLSSDVHVICNAINDHIGAIGKTVSYIETPAVGSGSHLKDITDLAADLQQKKVDCLLILGCNPVYTAPSDLNFAELLKNCPSTIRHGYYNDETSAECVWHIPSTHYLEEWSDVRAYDGTISIIQPLIAPLFGGRSAHQMLGLVLGDGDDGHSLVQASTKNRKVFASEFDKMWNRALNDGVIHNTKYPKQTPAFNAASISAIAPARSLTGIELNFHHDPTVWDGRYSNIGWLQELPKPLSKITWENAIFISPRTAQSLDLTSEDGVEVTLGGDSVVGPAWVTPGHPDNSITIHFGYGRWKSGIISNEIGFNAYKLRTSKAMNVAGDVQVKKVGRQSHPVATTQIHHSMEGRDIARMGTIEDYRKNRSLKEHEEAPVNAAREHQTLEEQSVYPDEIFNYDGPQWGMTIDMNTCIGCNACVTACQAENNIPVVGKDQVKRAREMHWLRIDRYYTSEDKWDRTIEDWDPVENPTYVFQPMMCVHCEKAPCEPVCPVGATMHSHEGLNQMVYNRCVGTRYCSNNCPYKVRRFNYLNFTDNQQQFTAKDGQNQTRVPLLRLLNNPDVTVRGRGVMEKCSYCVQRINDARIEAKKQGRDPKDGEIITACQQACPTKTITFGNIADKKSAVSKIRNDERAYGVLAELQTRPRTAHLGKIRNSNPEIKA